MGKREQGVWVFGSGEWGVGRGTADAVSGGGEWGDKADKGRVKIQNSKLSSHIKSDSCAPAVVKLRQTAPKVRLDWHYRPCLLLFLRQLTVIVGV